MQVLDNFCIFNERRIAHRPQWRINKLGTDEIWIVSFELIQSLDVESHHFLWAIDFAIEVVNLLVKDYYISIILETYTFNIRLDDTTSTRRASG